MPEEIEPLDPSPVSALYSTTFFTLVAGGAGLLLGIIRAKTAAVYLGERGVGILAQLNTLYGWGAAIASLGFSTACIKAIAEARGRGDTQSVRDIERFAFMVPLALGISIAGIIAAISPLVARHLLGDSDLSGYVLVATAAIPLTLLIISVSAILRGHEQVGTVAAIELTSSLVNTGLVFLVVIMWGLAGAVAGVLATSVVAVIAYAVRRPHSFDSLFRLRGHLPDKAIIKGIVVVGFAAFAWGAATRTTDLIVRAIIVGDLGIAANGIFQPAFQMSNQVMMTLMMGTSVYLLVKLSELAAAKDMPALAKEWNRGIRLMTLITFAVIAVAIPLRETIVRVLFSPDFVSGARLFPLELTGDFFRMLVWGMTAILLPLGLVKEYLVLALVGRILNVVVAATLIDTIGLVAVPLAYAVDWIATTAIGVVILHRRKLWLLTRSTTISLIASIAAVATMASVVPRNEGSRAVWVSVVIVLAWGVTVLRRADLDELLAMVGIRRDRRGSP